MSFTISPSQEAEKQVIDIPLYLPFLIFPPDEILRIMSAIMVEHRIVFIASNYALLTVIMEVINIITCTCICSCFDLLLSYSIFILHSPSNSVFCRCVHQSLIICSFIVYQSYGVFKWELKYKVVRTVLRMCCFSFPSVMWYLLNITEFPELYPALWVEVHLCPHTVQ